MQASLNTERDAELLFQYLDAHPEVELELSNRCLNRLSERFAKEYLEGFMKTMVSKMNDIVKDSPFLFEYNPAHPSKPHIVAQFSNTNWKSNFKSNVHEAAKEYASDSIKYVVKAQISEEIIKLLPKDISQQIDEEIKLIVQRKFNACMQAFINQALTPVK